MRLKTEHAVYENIEVTYERYANNDNLAIVLWNDTEGPIATLTVNLDYLMPGYAYVDINNCPWAEEFIKEYALGEPTGRFRESGYCTYPLYKFHHSTFKKGE